MAYPFGTGMDDQGNILIPFGMTDSDIPFKRWQMVSTKVWDSPGPVVVRSIILTHRGELFITYAKEINDQSEYPKEEVVEMDVISKYPPETIEGESLVIKDEKRSYK